MIPKIIHYCWFGKKRYPKIVKTCIATWKTHLPEYEFILWNEKNSPLDHNQFTLDAYKNRKYAFVSDYVRLWALYHYGGIYLDTDMYVIKNFYSLLTNKVFLGYEIPSKRLISAGVIGAEKESKFIRHVMRRYDELLFRSENHGVTKIPDIITNAYGEYIDKEEIKIYPYDYFYPFPFTDRDKTDEFLSYKTTNTYAIHLWNFSWRSNYMKSKIKLRKAVGKLVGERTYRSASGKIKAAFHLMKCNKHHHAKREK